MAPTAFYQAGSAAELQTIPPDALASHIVRDAARLRSIGLGRGEWIAANAPQLAADAARLLCGDSRFAREAEAAAETLGFSAPMIREGLREIMERTTPGALRAMQRNQLPTTPGLTAIPPALVFHVLAGNLFLSGIESMITASLAGSCSLVRCSARDTTFPFLWHRAVAAVSPALAETVAVAHWPAGLDAATAAACQNADAVVAHGGDDAVAAIRNLTPPGRRFIGHGTRVSFAIVAADALHAYAPGLADRLAYDFAVYDQQGCLSPRTAFIQAAGVDAVRPFAQLLRDAMIRMETALPRHPLGLAEAAALARARDTVLLDAATGHGACLCSATGDPFLVSATDCTDFEPGPVNRNCDLRVFPDTEILADVLAPYHGQIATIGLAGNLPQLQPLFRQLSVPRVCPIGAMQKPPVGWPHDGWQTLSALMDYQSVEEPQTPTLPSL